MDTQLRVTFPGPEGSADARRSLDVLNRFLTLLSRVEEATLPQQEDRPVSLRMRSLDVLSDAPASGLVGLDPNFTGGTEPTLYLREIRGAS